MTGEVIDEFSIKINADVDEMIETTQDAMSQIEEMFDELVEKGLKIKVPEAKAMATMIDALDDINEAMGNTIETSQLVEKSIKKLQDAGLSTAQAYIVLADAVSGVTQQTEALKELADAEAFELQSEMLGKVNEGLTIMESAWIAAGHAIPIEKLDALEGKLIKIFRTGIFDQKLSLEETFARMDEAIVESLVPLEKMAVRLAELDPKQVQFIKDETLRAREAFEAAGAAIPLEKLNRLEAQLVKISKLAGTDEKGMAEGFVAGKLAVDKLVGSLDNLIEKAERLEGKFKLREQGVAWKEIEKNVKRVERAWTKAGQNAPIEKMEQLRNKLERIFKLGLKSGKDFNEIFAQMGNAANDFLPPLEKTGNMLFNIANSLTRKFGVDLSQVMGKVNNLMRVGAQVASRFGISTVGLTTALTAVAAAFVIVGASIVVFIGWAKEGLALALKNSEAHQRLALAVRAHQRALQELSPTQKEAIAFAHELADTYNRTNVEMESLVATALFMTRQFKLSADQTLALAEAGAVLGEAAGVAPESALRSITNFMLTGYTQGLQQIGIFMDEDALFARALDMELVTLTGDMDANAKALAGLSLILEEVGAQQGDAAMAANTYAKSITESQARTAEAKEELGDFFKPLAAMWERIKSFFVISVIQSFVDLIEWMHRVTGQAIALGNTLGDVFDEVKRRVDELDIFPDEDIGDFATRKLAENMAEQEKLTQDFIDTLHGQGKDLDGLLGDQGEIWEELKIRIIAASADIQKELDKLTQKYDEASARIKQRFEDAKERIVTDFGRRRKDAARDLRRDVVDIDKDAREKEINTVVDHNKALFRLEEDHKLKMKRLEDQFLFDIEDAVRERDARGVLMAIRRFNQQKKEALQDKNLRTKRLKEDFKRELQEIELERRRRRAERMLEFAEQSDDLAEQEARRREDALAAFNRAERDLEEANRRQVTILAKGFLAQFETANASLNEIYGLLADYLEPGGFVSLLYQSIAAEAAALNLVPNISLSSQAYDPNNTTPGGFGSGSGYARGGTVFATSPQMILVGEVPERVDITPLSRSTGEARAGFGGRGGGGQTDISVDIGLEDGLVGEVVDQSLDAMANVVATVTKKTKQGAR